MARTAASHSVSESTQRLKRLNEALRAVYRFHRAIARETEPATLPQRCCDALIGGDAFTRAVVAATSPKGRVKRVYGAGFDPKSAADLDAAMRRHPLPGGLRSAFDHGGPAVLDPSQTECPPFLLAPADAPYGILAVGLGCDSAPLGVLAVTASLDLVNDPEAQRLIAEAGADLAAALKTAQKKKRRRPAAHRKEAGEDIAPKGWNDAEERQAIEALAGSDITAQYLINASPIGIGLVKDRILGWTNRTLQTMMGYSGKELQNMPARKLYPSQDEYERVGLLKYPKIRDMGFGAVETRMARKNGIVFDALLGSSPIRPGRMEDGLIFTVLDLTGRKRIERELHDSERRFRSIFENAPVGIFQSSLDGRRLLSANQQAAEMLKYESPMALVGASLDTPIDNLIYANPADRPPIIERVLKSPGWTNVETSFRCRDGNTIDVDMTLRAVRNASGKVDHLEGFIVDITESHRLQEQLAHSQKMEAVGQLAGGIAHDFNNLLGGILGYAQIGMKRLDTVHPVYRMLETIFDAGQQAADLVQQLLAFSRKQVLATQPLDLNARIEGVQKILGRLIGEDIELTVDLRADLPLVEADPSQIDQIVMNLAVNARDAMPKGGQLRLATRVVQLSEAEARHGGAPRAGPYAMLEVADTGTGMAPAILSRIFEPFFTTKGVGKGTGLGLSTAYGIAQQHGGFITAQSVLGEGATFCVYLPPAQRAETAPAEAGGARRAPKAPNAETVLVVEDEDLVRSTAGDILTELGYTVTLASSAKEALSHAATAKRIDLLLSDVVLPHCSGGDLAAQLTRLHPETAVLFMSGYTNQKVERTGISPDAGHFVQKPFTIESLAAKVWETLKRRDE